MSNIASSSLSLLFFLFLLPFLIQAQTGCKGSLPSQGIWTGEPALVNQTTNGKLFMVGEEDNQLQILHLYGTPYEMGLAQGQLLKDKILNMYDLFFNYIQQQANPYLDYLPEFLRKLIVDEGIEAALEYEVLLTRDFVPEHYKEEIRGLADGLGLTYGAVFRFSLFPELIKAACSIVGAWGPATSSGALYHLRALDWGTDNPFRLFPMLSVYHPSSNSSNNNNNNKNDNKNENNNENNNENEDNGHPFATLGWNGLLGALTGFSPYMGAGEKVWIHYNGTDIRAGIPWHFLFRDILQFDKNVTEALNRIETSTRTCSIFLGLGDHADPSNFKVVEYSHDSVEAFTDNSPFPGYAPTPDTHPLLDGVVYVDKHTQPSSDPCLGSILSKYHGQIDAETLVAVTSLLETGDMHAAVFDYSTNLALIALASQTVPYPPANATDVIPAYKRQFIQLDMNALFALEN